MKINVNCNSDREFIRKYITLTRSLDSDPPTPSEIELIIEFLLLPPKFEYQRFSIAAKRKVIQNYPNISNIPNINNKLHSLLKKKFLTKDEDKVIYLPKDLQVALRKFREDKQLIGNINFNGSNKVDN